MLPNSFGTVLEVVVQVLAVLSRPWRKTMELALNTSNPRHLAAMVTLNAS